MTLFRLGLCTAASLSLVGSTGAGTEALPETTISLNDANDCLSGMDEAREAADLPTLTQDSLFPTVKAEEQDPFLQSICETLLKEHTAETKATEGSKGTLAIFPLAEKAELDCSAAVENWQGGFTSFGENPPVKEDSLKYSDLDDQARSFVALYNPSDRIKGDCQVVVCKKQTAIGQRETGGPKVEEVTETGGGPPQLTVPSQPGAAEDGSGEAKDKTASALVCLTSPDAFAKNPLFSQQQWKKIAKALSNSTSFAVPTSLAFAAMLAVVLLL
ncbi:hypothetical protein Emag_004121 [Eimeria magna]